MTLYRMVYIREGKPRGTTFAARSDQAAFALAEKWTSSFGAKLLTVKLARPEQLRLPA